MYNLRPDINQVTIKNIVDRHQLDITLTSVQLYDVQITPDDVLEICIIPNHITAAEIENINMPAAEALRNTLVRGLIFLVIFIIITCVVMLTNPVCFQDLLVCIGLQIKEKAEEEFYVFTN